MEKKEKLMDSIKLIIDEIVSENECHDIFSSINRLRLLMVDGINKLISGNGNGIISFEEQQILHEHVTSVIFVFLAKNKESVIHEFIEKFSVVYFSHLVNKIHNE